MRSKHSCFLSPGSMVSSLINKLFNCASTTLPRLPALLLLLGMAVPAQAELSIATITWGTKGLDSNDVNTGPNQFPEGARVCSTVDAPNTTVTFNWNDAQGKFTSSTSPDADPYINLRDNTLDVLTLDIPAGECRDAYFEVEINRDDTAYDYAREFIITATDNLPTPSTVSTPADREVYVEYLISQSRNAVLGMDYKIADSADPFVSVAAGGTLTLAVGETYDIRMTASTATQGYEQLESFINFPNIIFQVIAVDTTYSAASGLGALNSDRLYSDACVWDDDNTSPTYRSCLLVGKAGGDITTVYTVKILQIPGAPLVNPQPLTTLIHDFSGSSYHYNADFSSSVRYANIIGSTISKSFEPKTIAPWGSSELTFTITNPKSTDIVDVSFTDNLPAGIGVVDSTTTECGGTLTTTDNGIPQDTVQDSIVLSGATIAGLGSCTFTVTVTAPGGVGSYDNVSENLFIGSVDTGSNATDSLWVSSLPPAPTSCDVPVSVANWNFDTTASGLPANPSPNTTPNVFDTTSLYPASATLNADPVAYYIPGTSRPLTDSSESSIASNAVFPTGWAKAPSDTTSNSWGIEGGWPDANNATLDAAAIGDPVALPDDTPYFQFEVDALDFGVVDLTGTFDLQGNWSNAGNYYILTSTDLTNWTLAGRGTWKQVNTFVGSTQLTGDPVYFRLFFAGAQYVGDGTTTATVYAANVDVNACPRRAPTMTKSFGTDPVGLGDVSTLTFTFQNPHTEEALTGVGFTDTLPDGVVVADTPNVTFPACSSGSITSPATDVDRIAAVTAVAGTSLIEMTEVFTLPTGADCSFTVDVKGVVEGTYTNTTSPITSTSSGPNTVGGPNVGYGQDDITVLPTPVISKAFGSPAILTGGTTTLTFNIANSSTSGLDMTNVSFTDTLPDAGDGSIVIASPNGLTGSCGDDGLGGGVGTITANAGSTTVSLSGATLLAGATCSFTVDVYSNEVGSYTNTTGDVTAVIDGTDVTGNTATANVSVRAPRNLLGFLKQVGSSDTGPWNTDIVVSIVAEVWYRFIIENIGETPVTGVNISDPDLDGLTPTTANCSWEDGDGNPLTAPFILPDINDDDDPFNEDHVAYCVLGAYSPNIAGLENTATTTNTSGAGNQSDTANYTVSYLLLDKRVIAGDPFSAAGDTISYEYFVANSGSTDLDFPVTVTDNKTTVTCPATDNPDGRTSGNNDAVLNTGETVICSATYTVTSTDVTLGQVTNVAQATVDGVQSNTDNETVFAAPTAVTIGKVELDSAGVNDFLAGLNVEGMSPEALLALLMAWDPDLGATLANADSQTLIDALANYLDPDGDGQLAVLRWDTLEERGTMGFNVERKTSTGGWIQINDEMLPGLITAPMGGEYQLADPDAQAGKSYQYRLIEQEVTGTTRTYGPFNVEIKP